VPGVFGAGPQDTEHSSGAGMKFLVDAHLPASLGVLRQRARVSQPVFAHYLNVSKNLVSDWERGKRKPGGPALRLLSIIQKHGLQMIA